MACTKQPRSLPDFDKTKIAEKPETLDPKATFLDSLRKLLVELDDLGKVAEKYFEDINIQLKNQEKNK